MDKQTVVCSYSGKLVNNKKKRSSDLQTGTDKSQKH